VDLSEKNFFAVLCNLPIFSHNAIVWQLVIPSSSIWLVHQFFKVMAGCHGLTLELQGLGHIVILGQQSTGTSQGGKLGPTVPAGQRETCWQEFF
jgi:hypothetical protein